MVKKIELPDIRTIVVREPINIDEPIFLDEHIPYLTRDSAAIQNAPLVHYPSALNFTKRIGTVDYVVNTRFSVHHGKMWTTLSQAVKTNNEST